MADPKDPPPLSERALAAELKARLRRAGVREADPPSMTRLRPAPAPPVNQALIAPPPAAATAAPATPPKPAGASDFAHPPAPSEAPVPQLPPARVSGDIAPESRRWRAGPLAIVVFFLTIAILLVAVLIYKAFVS